jgi:hypothetical protein
LNTITPARFTRAAALVAAAMVCGTSLAQTTPQPAPGTPRVQPVSPGTPSKSASPAPTTPAAPTNPATPSTPPSPAAPAQPGATPVQPVVPGAIVPATNHQPSDPSSQRLFAVEASQNARLQEFTTRLTRMEQQMAASNDLLLHDLGEARMNGGDTNAKLDKLFVMFQRSLQQNKQMQGILAEMRTSLTGQAGNPAATPTAVPTGPTTVPGANIPITPEASPTSPGTTGTGVPQSPSSPRSPTSNPHPAAPPTTPAPATPPTTPPTDPR